MYTVEMGKVELIQQWFEAFATFHFSTTLGYVRYILQRQEDEFVSNLGQTSNC